MHSIPVSGTGLLLNLMHSIPVSGTGLLLNLMHLIPVSGTDLLLNLMHSIPVSGTGVLLNLMHSIPVSGTGLLETCHSNALLTLEDEGKAEICTKTVKAFPSLHGVTRFWRRPHEAKHFHPKKSTVADVLTKFPFISFLFVSLKDSVSWSYNVTTVPYSESHKSLMIAVWHRVV